MDTATIKLPPDLEGPSLSQLAAAIVKTAKNGWPAKLTFDFSTLSFIRPSGVAFLSNLIYWLEEKGTKVTLQVEGAKAAPIEFLDDSLFFEQHCGKKLNSSASPRSTTRPLVRIAHKNSHEWLRTNFVPWLAERLEITKASLHTIQVCISELFNNIQDHTRYDIGCVFVQHFPNENRVICSISDMGLGIPKKIREKMPNLSDSEAILKAVEPGFTTKSKPSNQGIGLDYLLNAVVIRNGGSVTIYSGSDYVKFFRRKNEMSHVKKIDAGFCPGTTIDLEFRTDTIENVPDEREDLEW
ncbi:MAG: hypothetical protein QOH67_1990 [Hyphomicrobiales bacterium]|jgi:anti-sigma regulatory factor (Ser/Thr protein kinase)|nr:hypothetical protein [Hyphomicrobiales bacterium]